MPVNAEPAVDGVIVTDLVGLIPLLAVAYGVVMGAVALGTVWQSFTERRSRRCRRDDAAPLVGVIELGGGGVR